MSTPRPPVRSRISAAKSVVREFITWVTPIASRCLRFSAEPTVAKTSAPARRASCTAVNPTPPAAAWISTRSPRRIPPR